LQDLGWMKNRFGNKDRSTDANDGVVFTTTGEENKNNNKKKSFTCYKIVKSGHYSNECDE